MSSMWTPKGHCYPNQGLKQTLKTQRLNLWVSFCLSFRAGRSTSDGVPRGPETTHCHHSYRLKRPQPQFQDQPGSINRLLYRRGHARHLASLRGLPAVMKPYLECECCRIYSRERSVHDNLAPWHGRWYQTTTAPGKPARLRREPERVHMRGMHLSMHDVGGQSNQCHGYFPHPVVGSVSESFHPLHIILA
jgi:hypothetical protein